MTFVPLYDSPVQLSPRRMKTCCFTGHRDLPEGAEEEIILRVSKRLFPLFESGVRYYGVGGAMGFDTLVAKYLIMLRDKNRLPIKVISVLPFQGYMDRWPEAKRWETKETICRSDKVVYCAKHYSQDIYLIRDRHLVDDSGYCISYCTRTTGGTAFTVKYAKQQGLQVFNTADFQIDSLI